MFKCLSNLYYSIKNNIFKSTNVYRKKKIKKKKKKKKINIVKLLTHCIKMCSIIFKLYFLKNLFIFITLTLICLLSILVLNLNVKITFCKRFKVITY